MTFLHNNSVFLLVKTQTCYWQHPPRLDFSCILQTLMNSNNTLFNFDKASKDENHYLSITNFKPILYDPLKRIVKCKYSHHRCRPMYYGLKQYIDLHSNTEHKDMFNLQFHTISNFHLHWLSKWLHLLKYQQQIYDPLDGLRLNEHRYRLLLQKAIDIESQHYQEALALCLQLRRSLLRIPTP